MLSDIIVQHLSAISVYRVAIYAFDCVDYIFLLQLKLIIYQTDDKLHSSTEQKSLFTLKQH